MNKPYYSDYVRHCLRFYTRNLRLNRFRTKVDEDNWYSCYRSLNCCTDRDRDMLVAVYSGYDTLADNVYETAKKYEVNQAIIWDLMKDVEHKIAKRRGLI